MHKYGLIHPMVRETTDRAGDAYAASGIRRNRDLILASVLCIFVLLLAWLIFQVTKLPSGRPISLTIAGTSILTCLLTFVIERLLYLLHLGLRIRYHLSFLGSASLGWSFILYWNLLNSASPVSNSRFVLLVLWMGWVILWAFIGGLIATAYADGLVENNYPPSEEVADQVQLQHARLFDAPVKTPDSKRLFDLLLGLVGLVLSAPFWLVSALFIWLEDPGALLFVKNSVGRGGINFEQYKFRTMIRGAEEGTGPIMASQGDQRVLRTGRLLRQTALDELPQLINIVKGEMSFVGPRPQRTVMVKEYLTVMPEYAYRHQVLPGLAGLAQVVGNYYLTPRQKLRFDRIYIQHANLGFDLLLIFLAFLITFGFRWKKDWNGRLPRGLLHGRPGR
jgi:lipopolysaccharide/colanic/teichoic acid biosynthesis glycosyltransferase